MALDLRLGLDLGQRGDQVKAEKRLSDEKMACAVFDAGQCQFGMTSVDSVENVGPACKATGIMTNDEYIAEAVNRHCFGGHDQHPVVERQSEIF